MKLVKSLLKAILWIVVLVVVALLALPLWFGPVVKGVANAVAPKVVKTDFSLAHLAFNPYTARFELGGLVLSNPAGYAEKTAARVGELTFDADTLSLATDIIHIEEIKVKDIFVSYVNGGPEKVNNFQQIQYNVAGGREKYEAAQAKKEEQAKLEELQAKETAQETREPEPEAEEKAEKKFIIDRMEISGLVVQLGILPVRVPSITLTDLGKSSGGATVGELSQEIWDGILKAAGAVGDQFKKLGSGALDIGTSGVNGAVDAVKEIDLKGAGKSLEKAGKELENLFK